MKKNCQTEHLCPFLDANEENGIQVKVNKRKFELQLNLRAFKFRES